MLRIANRYQYINCWHINESESAGMWQLYINGNEGVAIQSTFGDLKECLSADTHQIYLGAVDYIDYAKESWGEYQPLTPIFHKRMSFAHEKEIRAVIVNPPGIDPKKTDGILVNVDLNRLVNKIFVPPKSRLWFIQTVEAVASTYGLETQTILSRLYDEPDF